MSALYKDLMTKKVVADVEDIGHSGWCHDKGYTKCEGESRVNWEFIYYNNLNSIILKYSHILCWVEQMIMFP